MPATLVQVGASAICPHGGQVSITPGNARVKLGGQAAATLADTFTIAGCAFTIPPGKPQPCAKVQWIVAALRVKIGGQAAILQTSTGLCQSADQIPQGPPTISSTQARVKGT
jgi:hypothetical protein